MRNPVSVLPIVYRRLRQKDIEWRRLRSEMSKEWNAVNEANYEASLDVLCSSYKKELERVVSPEQLMKVSRHGTETFVNVFFQQT
jgi:paired amphipathic helix protein Sin3a